MGKYRNKVLFSIFKVNILLFILAGCSLDSESNVPFRICIVTGAWITWFITSNNYFIAYTGRDTDEDY